MKLYCPNHGTVVPRGGRCPLCGSPGRRMGKERKWITLGLVVLLAGCGMPEYGNPTIQTIATPTGSCWRIVEGYSNLPSSKWTCKEK